jgi:hypothetical protein
MVGLVFRVCGLWVFDFKGLFVLCGDGVLWILPIPCFFVVLVGFLVWAVFWVLLGWGDGYTVCWMGWDRMGDLFCGLRKMIDNA